MKQRKFEFPYNFDKDFVKKVKPHQTYIDTVYIPMFMEDGLTTRIFYQVDWYPKSRDEYVWHITQLINNGFKPNVLIQDPIKKFTAEELKWYIALGVKHFTVYQDSVARKLREIDNSVVISASITKKLLPDDIAQLPSGLYDNVILHFAYNHSLDIIKNLRKDIRYIIVANVECHQDCWGTHHWYQTLEYDEKTECWNHLDNPRLFKHHCSIPSDECAIVFPEYLHYYDEHISVYKLIDRTFPTERNLMFLQMFANTENKKTVDDNYLNRNNIRFFKKIKFLPNERSLGE